MDYGQEINIQYVELSGVVGIFVKLDASTIDPQTLENLLHATQQQIRLIVRACSDGSKLHVESYTKSNERIKKGKHCHCRYCEEAFHCRADLVSHQTKHHPHLPIRAGKRARKPCPTCGRLVLNVALHMRTKHASDTVVNYAAGLVQCRQCEETYPVNTDHASVCRLSPTCPECKKTFSQWRVMNKHRKIVHMGEKITCPTCHKTYHDAQSLKKHIEAVHTKIKRVCPLCGATVTSLSGHMNAVHADNRKFACPNCDKRFKSKYDLSRHRDNVHLGHKPACPYCGKHLANLDQHIRVVHKQIRFTCTICSKQLNTKADLRKHVDKIHGNAAATAVAQNNTYAEKLQVTERLLPQYQQQPQHQPQHHHQQEHEQHNQLLPEESYISSRELSEDQLIAQYLGKQFNPNPMKQEVLTDPALILCKEEQILIMDQAARSDRLLPPPASLEQLTRLDPLPRHTQLLVAPPPPAVERHELDQQLHDREQQQLDREQHLRMNQHPPPPPAPSRQPVGNQLFINYPI